eukprot:251152-Chlamydomonas_euryale.AAC.1
MPPSYIHTDLPWLGFTVTVSISTGSSGRAVALVAREEEFETTATMRVDQRKMTGLERTANRVAGIQAARCKTMRHLVEARKCVQRRWQRSRFAFPVMRLHGAVCLPPRQSMHKHERAASRLRQEGCRRGRRCGYVEVAATKGVPLWQEVWQGVSIC